MSQSDSQDTNETDVTLDELRERIDAAAQLHSDIDEFIAKAEQKPADDDDDDDDDGFGEESVRLENAGGAVEALRKKAQSIADTPAALQELEAEVVELEGDLEDIDPRGRYAQKVELPNDWLKRGF